jgi:hypothetical protein
VLKALDAQWTEGVSQLLAAFPGAIERYAGLPVQGDPRARGPWADFRQSVFALLREHHVSALYLESDGAFCALRSEPLSFEIAVAGRVRVRRERRQALLAKFSFEENLAHYLKRLEGVPLAACLTKTEWVSRNAEREKLKVAERRIDLLVHQCCTERRTVDRYVRRSRRRRSSPQAGG